MIAKKIIGAVGWVAVMFVGFPFLFGAIPWPWAKFTLFAIWTIMLVGQISYVLFHGIQGDFERLRKGQDIITGDKYEK